MHEPLSGYLKVALVSTYTHKSGMKTKTQLHKFENKTKIIKSLTGMVSVIRIDQSKC